MRICAILVPFIIVACGDAHRPAPDSVSERPSARSASLFAVGIWPGEGVPVIAAVRGHLPLLRSPAPGAPVTDTLTARVGDHIAYDSTRLQTVTPAVVRVIRDATVRGRYLGSLRFLSRDRYYSGAFRDTAIAIEATKSFEYLQPRAEGTCFVRIDGSVIDADPCPILDPSRFASAGEPQTLWWVFARGASDSGWLLVSDSTARVVRRGY